MVSIGMIFQFNSDEGSGLIMLSDGATKEFTTRDWTDESNAPAVGLKISSGKRPPTEMTIAKSASKAATNALRLKDEGNAKRRIKP